MADELDITKIFNDTVKAVTKATQPAKKTTAKKTTAKKTTTPAGANTSMKVTASEKKLIEAYRGASGELKNPSSCAAST